MKLHLSTASTSSLLQQGQVEDVHWTSPPTDGETAVISAESLCKRAAQMIIKQHRWESEPRRQTSRFEEADENTTAPIGTGGLNYRNHPERGPFKSPRGGVCLLFLDNSHPQKMYVHINTPPVQILLSHSLHLQYLKRLLLSTWADEMGLRRAPRARCVKINRADVQICGRDSGSDGWDLVGCTMDRARGKDTTARGDKVSVKLLME